MVASGPPAPVRRRPRGSGEITWGGVGEEGRMAAMCSPGLRLGRDRRRDGMGRAEANARAAAPRCRFVSGEVMRYVAAYLLAVLGGNESPTSKDLKKILDSVGIETDDERMNKVALPLNSRRPSQHQTLELFLGFGVPSHSLILTSVISELNGKNIEDVIAQGNGKLASMPAGGAVAVSAGGGSAAPAAAAAPAAGESEEKKEEKKEESEESDDDMGFGLFD
ncbi:hypothetical protein DUI87_22840 [Hirundo rustica rustica]|uniref:Large ribosomal subunit protein P2 n=1 Tax=Hirundo rustica rustica TaxID=333673 RepID=A0A3M0JHT0_HIRRU|nr:hypothetical protein DUI87_22840 [Hirundo rustica rustica]